jgi:excisionase family DNA binding protein
MAMTEAKFARRRTLRAVNGAPATAEPAGVDSGAEPNGASTDTEPLADRLAYSVAEAALITGLSRDLLYDQMRAGKLGYLKVGRRRIITRRSLDAFLAKPAS